MKLFNVRVHRVGRSEADVEVLAHSVAEAKALAERFGGLAVELESPVVTTRAGEAVEIQEPRMGTPVVGSLTGEIDGSMRGSSIPFREVRAYLAGYRAKAAEK